MLYFCSKDSKTFTIFFVLLYKIFFRFKCSMRQSRGWFEISLSSLLTFEHYQIRITQIQGREEEYLYSHFLKFKSLNFSILNGSQNIYTTWWSLEQQQAHNTKARYFSFKMKNKLTFHNKESHAMFFFF